MTMRSPIVAMLWENWRLTRVEAAQRLALGIVAGSAALLLFDNGATLRSGSYLLDAFFWSSIAKLNGGRFMDGYKPGFPLYLLYTRPVPTVVVRRRRHGVRRGLVRGVVSRIRGSPGVRLRPAAPVVLRGRVDRGPPSCYTCIQWSTRKQSRSMGWIAASIACRCFFLLQDRVESPLQVEFSLAEIRTDGPDWRRVVRSHGRRRSAAAPRRCRRDRARPAGSGGYPDWLVNLFRFPCPTSSATRAQVWFELKSSGLPVLAIGLALAILIFLLFAISISVEPSAPLPLPRR